MIDTTAETEGNGRDSSGKFSAGNQFARGQSRRKHAEKLRRAFAEAVTEDDVADIARGLVSLAKDGDTQAAKLVLERCCGKVQFVDTLASSDLEAMKSGAARLLEGLANMQNGAGSSDDGAESLPGDSEN